MGWQKSGFLGVPGKGGRKKEIFIYILKRGKGRCAPGPWRERNGRGGLGISK